MLRNPNCSCYRQIFRLEPIPSLARVVHQAAPTISIQRFLSGTHHDIQ